MSRPVPGWLRALVVGSAVVVVFRLERRRPLRRQRGPARARCARNLSLAATSALAIYAVEQPIVSRLVRRVERRRGGLGAPRFPVPAWARTLASVALLDYTLYVWHVLTHRVTLLWRFHAPHHADLDLDSTTGLRFHFGEMLLSVPWRAAQVIVIGPTARELTWWQTLTLVSILFHHSNLRLPERLERVLARVFVTPRMHGIHHSQRVSERSSNWSSGLFSFWDRLHGTFRLDLAQDDVEIGLPGLAGPGGPSLYELLAFPFRRGRNEVE